jgi:hypothetical protein
MNRQDGRCSVNRDLFLGPRPSPALFAFVGVILAQGFGTDRVRDSGEDTGSDFEAQVLERLIGVGCVAAHITCATLSEFALEDALDDTFVIGVCSFIVHFIQDV